MLLWVLGLALWWILLHILLGGGTEEVSPTNSRRRSSSFRSTHVELGLVWLQVTTTGMNLVPVVLLQPFRKHRRRKMSSIIGEDERPLARLWDVGALLGVAGIVVGQAVLAWAAVRSVSVLYRVLSTEERSASLVKRGMERAIRAAVPSSELLIRPVVSNVTNFSVQRLTEALIRSLGSLSHSRRCLSSSALSFSPSSSTSWVMLWQRLRG